MVHIEITSWFPSSKNQEVTNKYIEVLQDPGMPSSVKSFKIFSKATKGGTRTIAYLEIEPGKMEEAYTDMAPILETFSEIEGYSFEYGIALSQEEVLAAQQQG